MNCSEYCPTGSRLEKLLLATDRTEYSEGAIREAINFAKRCSSKLYAMTVVEMYTEIEAMGEKLYDLEDKMAKEHLDAIKARAEAEGVRCETVVHHGENPHELIAEEAVDKKVDMIFTGKRGSKGLAKLMLGAVAAKVIGYAPCDVLVVPKAAKIEYNHILVATDGSEHSKAAVKKAVDIAKRCASNVIALSVMRDESERKEAEQCVAEAAEIAKGEGVKMETMTPKGRPYEAIVETAGGRAVDLIVMGTYGKTGLQKILMGSQTERVIGLSGCAVLVVK